MIDIYIIVINSIEGKRLFEICNKSSIFDKLDINSYIYDKEVKYLSQIMQRYIGQKHTNKKMNELDININKWGKPYIKDCCSYNVSHSNKIVGITTNTLEEIGFDIEYIDVQFEIKSVLKFFNSLDINYIYSCENETKIIRRFFEVWVIKESFLKLLGRGLTIELSSVKINYNNREVKLEKDNTIYNYKKIHVHEDYAAVICTKGIINNINYINSNEEIMKEIKETLY